ncbi:formate dehydrogenase subunit delta [Pseudorhodobacter aquimaris]|uniref:formate dehydrogenase subunit delta n=1 Tax=Pseudorhodobacter aquimaris TaxID=687412 RepID=UPI00067B9A3F|nr:formate dehydrogenase subunit delta [Pseudorhodobacter aquimaris]
MSPEKMAYMANQIATFFRSQPEAGRVEGIAAHLGDFWEPRMLEQLYTHIDGGAAGLDPLVIEAAKHVQQAKAA